MIALSHCAYCRVVAKIVSISIVFVYTWLPGVSLLFSRQSNLFFYLPGGPVCSQNRSPRPTDRSVYKQTNFPGRLERIHSTVMTDCGRDAQSVHSEFIKTSKDPKRSKAMKLTVKYKYPSPGNFSFRFTTNPSVTQPPRIPTDLTHPSTLLAAPT